MIVGILRKKYGPLRRWKSIKKIWPYYYRFKEMEFRLKRLVRASYRSTLYPKRPEDYKKFNLIVYVVVLLVRLKNVLYVTPLVYIFSERHKTLFPTMDLIVVSNTYPKNGREKYGGEFIRARVDSYKEKGLKVLVIELTNDLIVTPRYWKEEGVLSFPCSCWRILQGKLTGFGGSFFFHSPRIELTESIINLSDRGFGCTVFYHGFEVRDFRRLCFNYSIEDMSKQYFYLKDIHDQRMACARVLWGNVNIEKVVVSNYLKKIAFEDLHLTKVEKLHVIPNFIDSAYFSVGGPSSLLRKNILMIRPFTANNYAADIAIKAILEMEKDRPKDFSELSFTIVGFGRNFAEFTDILKSYPNVDLVEKYQSKAELKEKFEHHGVYLAPTRFDTQGVTMCEAMSAGLVPVVNNTGGISEFANTQSAVLVKPNCYKSFAKGVWVLVDDEEAFAKKSKEARKSILEICSEGNTIARELGLVS